MGLYSGGLIYGPTFVLRFWWAYIRGGNIWEACSRNFKVYADINFSYMTSSFPNLFINED